jgi:hypothetical protein
MNFLIRCFILLLVLLYLDLRAFFTFPILILFIISEWYNVKVSIKEANKEWTST